MRALHHIQGTLRAHIIGGLESVRGPGTRCHRRALQACQTVVHVRLDGLQGSKALGRYGFGAHGMQERRESHVGVVGAQR